MDNGALRAPMADTLKHVSVRSKPELVTTLLALCEELGLPLEEDRIGGASKADLIDKYYLLKHQAADLEDQTPNDSNIIAAMQRQSNEANAQMDALLEQMMADRQATDRVMTPMLGTLRTWPRDTGSGTPTGTRPPTA